MKFDGSKGNKDLHIKDKVQQGLFYRYGSDYTTNKLVTGSLKRVR